MIEKRSLRSLKRSGKGIPIPYAFKCHVCRKGCGELIHCKKCHKAFHCECLNIEKENLPKHFFCVRCK